MAADAGEPQSAVAAQLLRLYEGFLVGTIRLTYGSIRTLIEPLTRALGFPLLAEVVNPKLNVVDYAAYRKFFLTLAAPVVCAVSSS